jgi:hypothetical protein
MTSELATYDEKGNETEDFALTVPKQVGGYAWSVLFPRHEIESVAHEECSLPISFRAIPHKTSMAVWDVPSPVATNGSFKVKVGMQCSAACQLTGQAVEVRDQAGDKIGEGTLGETPWTGTSALYWAEVELAAPATEGVSFRSVNFTAVEELELPHEGVSATFSFRTDKPPEHRVTVKVVERKTEAPLEDVEVLLGFYMASTDQRGAVTIGLPKGTYELSIRKDGYSARPMSVDVGDDLTVQMEASTAPTRADMEEKLMECEDYPGGGRRRCGIFSTSIGLSAKLDHKMNGFPSPD